MRRIGVDGDGGGVEQQIDAQAAQLEAKVMTNVEMSGVISI